MSISVTCGECFHPLTVNDRFAGKRVRCPECGAAVAVPAHKSPGDFEHETTQPAPVVKRSRTPSPKKSAQKSASPLVWVGIGVGVIALLVAVAIVAYSVGRTQEAPPAIVAEKPPTPEAGPQQPVPPSGSPDTPEPAPGDPLPEPVPKQAGEPDVPLADLIERVGNGVVLLSVKDWSGRDIAVGTGFLVDQSGLVATNFHVVAGGSQAIAQFQDETVVNVVGYRAWDDQRDLAILQLEKLPPNAEVLQLDATHNPRRGDGVIAIGHPAGFRFSTSRGFVSGLPKTTELPQEVRQFMAFAEDQDWIQTDATIASGSSGGPLLNINGEVIGINTWVTKEFGFASHVRHLADLLNEVAEKVTPLVQVGNPLHDALGELDDQVASVWSAYESSYEEYLVRTWQGQNVRHPAQDYANRLIALAQSHPRTQIAHQALVLTLSLSQEIVPQAIAETLITQATETLLRDHLAEESLGISAVMLTRSTVPKAGEFLQKLLEKSPHHGVRGLACFSLAMSQIGRAGLTQHEQAQLTALLERVVAEFNDVRLGRASLGEVAEPVLFERKHLSAGREAADIVGRDVKGEEFKLSNFRGRVVMLDFFTDRWPHLYPSERVWIEKYKDRPFVLLGVNADTKDRLQQLIDEQKVTWRTWSDGADGPIAKRWNLQVLPTVYLLDHNGIIRRQFIGNPNPDELAGAIERMVTRAEAENEGVLPGDFPYDITEHAGRDAALDWIMANNIGDTEVGFLADLRRSIDANIARGFPNLRIIFEPGLFKPNVEKAHELCIWDDQFFVFELSGDQTRAIDFEKTSIHMSIEERLSRKDSPLFFKLEELVVNDGQPIDCGSRLTGHVTCSGRPTIEEERYIVRFSHRAGGAANNSFRDLEPVPHGSRLRVPFDLSSVNQSLGQTYEGPLLLYVDICKMQQNQRHVMLTPVSNAVASLIDVTHSGGEIRQFVGHRGRVTSVAASPDGRHGISAGFDKTVRLWDLETGREVRRFEGHQSIIWGLGFSPDGRLAISSSQQPESLVIIWDVETGKQRRVLMGHASGSAVGSVTFSPDGKHAASSSWDRTTRIWEVSSGMELHRFTRPTQGSVVFTPDGRSLFFGSGDGSACLLDAETGKEIRRFVGHSEPIYAVAVSADGRFGLTAGGKDLTARLWDLEAGKEVRRFAGHTATVMEVALSPDGSFVLSGSGDPDSMIRLWNANTGEELHRFEGHKGAIGALDFLSDGQRFLSGSFDGTVRLWKLPPAVLSGGSKPSTESADKAAPAKAGGRKIVIDASKDLGVWGSNAGQGAYQGRAFVNYTRSRDWEVDEIARGEDITDRFRGATIVIRPPGGNKYKPSEVQAYRQFVSQGGSLLLLQGYANDNSSDPIAEAFEIEFSKTVRAPTIKRWAAHPLTKDLPLLKYNVGSVVTKAPQSHVPLAYLENDELVMGICRHGKGKIIFISTILPILPVPQPFTERLLQELSAKEQPN